MVDALRVSVTDRCNLRCVYCMPPEGARLIPRGEILSFEEIERVVRAAVGQGVKKVRLTGGEPLARTGIVELIAKLARIEGVLDLPMTTNGVLLAGAATELKKAGLRRVTVSLDTLKRDRFERISGRPELDRVMAGIEAALEAGLTPLKINVVVVPNENDDEVMDFVRLAMERGLEVRFIERMPIFNRELIPHCGLMADEYVPSAELKKRIEAEFGALNLAGDDGRPARGPAVTYELAGGRGRIGFIAPRSEPFCKWCGRMRLTPDGRLRACLTSEAELDVKAPLRSGISDAGLAELFNRAVSMKPIQESACFDPTNRIMSQIGG